MRQATLVALYGDKPDALASLVGACQATLAGAAGALFSPYDLAQIHATVVGLERAPGDDLCNLGFARLRNTQRRMDVAGFRAFVEGSGLLPLDVQLAGFPEGPHPVVSRGQGPYQRSFSIQGDKAVLIGWPVRRAPPDTLYPATLDDLRRAAQGFGILHAYHRAPADVDNDFYLRLGTFAHAPEPALAATLARRLRAQLAAHAPVTLAVGLDDLQVVSYLDDTLPPATSRAVRLRDVRATEPLSLFLA